MKQNIKLHNQEKTINDIENIVKHNSEFDYIEKLCETFYCDLGKKDKQKEYYRMVDFVLDKYNQYVKNIYQTRAKTLSIYDLLASEIIKINEKYSK